MKKVLVLWIVLAVAVTWMMQLPAEAQTLKIRFAGNMPAQYHSSKAMVVFKEEVEKLSGGKIQVDLFPGDAAWGGQRERGHGQVRDPFYVLCRRCLFYGICS